MSDRLLERVVRRRAANTNDDPILEDADDLGCFGWLRGVRDRSIMLELRKKDGHTLAIGYAWIERVELVPHEGITLHLPGRKVRITGSGLNVEARPTVRLFDGIIRHRVPWIREADRAELLRSGSGACIERIEWDA